MRLFPAITGFVAATTPLHVQAPLTPPVPVAVRRDLDAQLAMMHACGHDAGTAIPMGVAEVLAVKQARLPGSVTFSLVHEATLSTGMTALSVLAIDALLGGVAPTGVQK